MKIAFDAQLFLDETKTGIGWYAYNVLNELNRHQYTFQFNCYCKNSELEKIEKFKQFLISNNFDFEIINCSKISIWTYRVLSTFLPVMYYYNFGQNADATFFFNYVIPPGVKGKKITMIHDMTYKAYPKTQRLKSRLWLKFSMKRTCKRADHIITASQFSKDEIIKYLHVPEQKVKVISCGVNTDLFNNNYSNEQIEKVKEKYVINGEYYLYVGTLEPRKNIERLIKAYSAVKSKYKSIPKLVLCGKKGWLFDKVFSLVKELNIESDVIFTGYAEDEEIPILMKGAKIFIYPSIYEGFGMPPLEAMACGTPVITSEVSSLPEVIGDAGILVNPFSIHDIEKAIIILEENESLRCELALRGYERSKKFTWDAVGRNIVDILENLER